MRNTSGWSFNGWFSVLLTASGWSTNYVTSETNNVASF